MDLKIFKIKKSFRKGGGHIHPMTSWKIILFIALVLIVSAFAFGFSLFKKIDKELIISAEETRGQIRIVKKERIQKALEYFSEREKKSAEILISPLPVVDPSM